MSFPLSSLAALSAFAPMFFWRCRCCSSPFVTHWKFSTDNPPKVLQKWDNGKGFPPGTGGMDVGAIAVEPSDGSTYVATMPFDQLIAVGGRTVSAWNVDGSKRWTSQVISAFPNAVAPFYGTAAAVASGVVAFILVQGNYHTNLVAFLEADGTPLWSHTPTPVVGTTNPIGAPEFLGIPIIGSMVVAFDGDFIAFPLTGFGPPFTFNGQIGTDDIPCVARYRASSGAVLWQTPQYDAFGANALYFFANATKIYVAYAAGPILGTYNGGARPGGFPGPVSIPPVRIYSVDGGSGAMTAVGLSSVPALNFQITIPPVIFSDGSIGYADWTTSPTKIVRANADATISTRWTTTLPHGQFAWSLAVDGSDNIYALNSPGATDQYGSRQLTKYDKNGRLIYNFTIPSTPVDTPGNGNYGDPGTCLAVNPMDQTPYVGGWRQKPLI